MATTPSPVLNAGNVVAPAPDAVGDDNEDLREELYNAVSAVGNLKVKKRGRQTSDLWEMFTDAAEAQKAKSHHCKHCNEMVNYHRKTEQVRTHLNNCSKFKKTMNGGGDADRPDWLIGKKRSQAKLGQVDVGGASSSRQASIRQFTVPKVTKAEKARFKKHLAMHFYATGGHSSVLRAFI